VLPERQQLAQMIPLNELFTHSGMLSVVADLLTLCTRDYDVVYRPGEEPLGGKC
ncbi:hypothetical protein M432DRAFT_542044, partial [Thermoascus aurantiacus ATCC 26904]